MSSGSCDDADLYDFDSGNESPQQEDNDPSDEDDNLGMDIGLGQEAGPSSRANESLDEDYQCEVLSTEQIVKDMTNTIKEVNTVTETSTTIIRVLLNHFKWDKERFMERFFSDDQDQMFIEAGLIPPSSKITAAASCKSRSRHSSLPIECGICFMRFIESTMKSLECGHLFCEGCWKEYLTSKISQGVSQLIECPGSRCKVLVDDQAVLGIIDPSTKLKYLHLITNNFVLSNRLLKWCPAPDCSNAVKVNHVEAKAVKCSCGHIFCFGCSEAWHDPVRCHLIKKWIKKCDDDSATSIWISANTKDCPKCNATIEKDGGCNHMICKNPSCKMEFCWVCLAAWEPHGTAWYNCNRYDEAEARSARDAQEQSRAALQRYLFYCNRYINHLQSLKFENRLYAKVKDKMEEMQQLNMSWIEVQFLKKAVDILCECRRTLMYTYVFAYYLVKNNQSEIFEANQKDLEQATETLSEFLERDISEQNLGDIKQKVQDKYRYCDSRRKVLLDHVHEGYDSDCWVYTE